MNERIRELAEQCHHRYSEHNIDLDKFAQLIIQECIEVIDMTHGSKKLMRPDPYQKIIWAIEEHFGVAE